MNVFISIASIFVTAIFSFLAYQYTRLNFRLALFEKRWVVYENLRNFLISVEQLSFGITQDPGQFYKNINGSFRDIGYAKSKFLFDETVMVFLKKMNSEFSSLLGDNKEIQILIEKQGVAIQYLEEAEGVFKKYLDFSKKE